MLVHGCSIFSFNDTATTQIYTYRHTLSLPDALPICAVAWSTRRRSPRACAPAISAVPPSTSSPRSRSAPRRRRALPARSEEHTSELQSLMRISYAVFCLKTNTYLPIKPTTYLDLTALTHTTTSTLPYNNHYTH